MYPILINAAGEKLAYINNIESGSAKLKQVVNGEFTFKFDAHFSELKSEFFEKGNLIVIDDQKFDISYIAHIRDGGVYHRIESEHVSYRLIDTVLDSFVFTGAPIDCLSTLLSGTDFDIGTVDFTDDITIQFDDPIDTRTIIKELASLLGGEIEYTNSGFNIGIRDTIGSKYADPIRFGKNLLSISRIWDKKEDSISYQIEVAILKNSNQYKELGLSNLESYNIGDRVVVIDELSGITTEQEVLSIVRNPILEESVSIELVNKIKLITDKIKEIETEMVSTKKSYNKVSISKEYGFKAELSDKTARTIMNSKEISMDISNGDGSYQKALYFDPVNGRYKFKGEIEVEAISGVSADDIPETSGRKWAAQSGADVTSDNISLDTSNIDGVPSIIFSGWRETGKTTINGGKIETDTVTAIQIAALAVDTEHLAANAVTASKISVNELSAISADIGNVTAGVMTGVIIRTSSSGERIQISNDDFKTYNSANQMDGIQILRDKYNEISFYSNGVDEARITRALDSLVIDTDDVTFLLDGNLNISASSAYYKGKELATLDDIPPTGITHIYAGHGLDASGSGSSIDLWVDESELDFGNESRSWFESSLITRPYYSGNYCYVDTDGEYVVFRDKNGDTVLEL